MSFIHVDILDIWFNGFHIIINLDIIIICNSLQDFFIVFVVILS